MRAKARAMTAAVACSPGYAAGLRGGLRGGCAVVARWLQRVGGPAARMSRSVSSTRGKFKRAVDTQLHRLQGGGTAAVVVYRWHGREDRE